MSVVALGWLFPPLPTSVAHLPLTLCTPGQLLHFRVSCLFGRNDTGREVPAEAVFTKLNQQLSQKLNMMSTCCTVMQCCVVNACFCSAWFRWLQDLFVYDTGFNAFCKWEPYILVIVEVDCAVQDAIELTLSRTMLTLDTIL